MKKICNKCNQEKPIERFERLISSYKGKKYNCISYRNKCKDCKSQEVLASYKQNRNVEVIKLRERARKKRKENPSIHRYNNILFKQHIKKATPPWADKVELKAIYDNRPAGYDVDHIIPLRGKNVCGLHIPVNLQYLPSDENRNKKRNIIDYVSTSALQVKKST